MRSDGGFRVKYLASSGVVTTAGKAGDIAGFVINGTGAGAIATFKDGTASGTTRFTVNAPNTGAVVLPPTKVNFSGLFKTDIYLTLSNATAIVWYVEYSDT